MNVANGESLKLFLSDTVIDEIDIYCEKMRRVRGWIKKDKDEEVVKKDLVSVKDESWMYNLGINLLLNDIVNF